MDKLELLKKENELLKRMLEKIKEHELYELDYIYGYDDEVHQIEKYFPVDMVIMENVKNSEIEVKNSILTYFKLK